MNSETGGWTLMAKKIIYLIILGAAFIALILTPGMHVINKVLGCLVLGFGFLAVAMTDFTKASSGKK